MRRNEYLDTALAELKRVGILPNVVHGGTHIHVKWMWKNEARLFVVPSTPSDHRGMLNSRAELVRLLRHDGVYALLEDRTRTKKVFDIKNRPIPEDWLQRIRNLEQDVADLTQIVIDQATVIVNAGMIPHAHPAPIEETIETVTRTHRRYAGTNSLLDHLTMDGYTSIHTLSSITGEKLENLASKLQYLKKKNLVENKRRVGWRKLSSS